MKKIIERYSKNSQLRDAQKSVQDYLNVITEELDKKTKEAENYSSPVALKGKRTGTEALNNIKNYVDNLAGSIEYLSYEQIASLAKVKKCKEQCTTTLNTLQGQLDSIAQSIVQMTERAMNSSGQRAREIKKEGIVRLHAVKREMLLVSNKVDEITSDINFKLSEDEEILLEEEIHSAINTSKHQIKIMSDKMLRDDKETVSLPRKLKQKLVEISENFTSSNLLIDDLHEKLKILLLEVRDHSKPATIARIKSAILKSTNNIKKRMDSTSDDISHIAKELSVIEVEQLKQVKEEEVHTFLIVKQKTVELFKEVQNITIEGAAIAYEQFQQVAGKGTAAISTAVKEVRDTVGGVSDNTLNVLTLKSKREEKNR